MTYDDKKIKLIAKICCDTNKSYSDAIGDFFNSTNWEDAPDWLKESMINGVKAHLENDLSPSHSHQIWMQERISQGWIYGKEKDITKRTHPCLVEYDQLPPAQKIKDYLFKNIVLAFKVNL